MAAAEMRSQEVAVAGLHADAVALLLRLELAAGQSSQEAAAQRNQGRFAASLSKRQSQAVIWGKTTTTQQRLDQARLQKVKRCSWCMRCMAHPLHCSPTLHIRDHETASSVNAACP